jgi:hypothetical protein
MTNSDKSDEEEMEMKVYSMLTSDDLMMQMIEFQENIILTAKFTELRRDVEMLVHIPRAENNRKYCCIF